MKKIYSFCTLFIMIHLIAQTGSITFSVYDALSRTPISVTVSLDELNRKNMGIGTIPFNDLPAGTYRFNLSSEGYEDEVLNDITILPNQNIAYNVEMKKLSSGNISTVILKRNVYKTTAESPVSLRNITSEEVQKNPGANRDVSKAMLSLPGVGTTATFRNDLFIRGGSSAENRFFVDGIEVPIINHFQTQGASGGPRGILTIDFIKDVDFYSGAFPTKRNGTLSSLFEFNLKQARRDHLGYKFIGGLDDTQLMVDGPLSKDQSWSGLFSVRRSNLQILFKSLGLPFLPTYYDTNIKISKKFDTGHEFYFLMIGAIDQFKLNTKAKATASNLALLERLPVAPQWNYTTGIGYRHTTENGHWLLTWSRNLLNNEAQKYYKNIETPENRILDYQSREIENKTRIDRVFRWRNFKISTGINFGFIQYENTSRVKRISATGSINDNYESYLNFEEYGGYLQLQNKFLDNRLDISVGIRLDANTYSPLMNRPLKQLSPRISARYQITPQWFLNTNFGKYFMKPSYTAMGYKEHGSYTNQAYLKYISNTQWIAGVEHLGKQQLRLTAELYYKKYENYPFSLRNRISLANIGSDFGVIGAEALDARSHGESYGIEFLAQKRTLKNFYGIASYTFGYSKFSNTHKQMLPSSWDTRHIIAITGGKYLKRNWNIGGRFRMQSGFPQTPYDLNATSLVSNWMINNGPIYDYSKINSLRGNWVHQLDLRVEKKWIFNKWQLTFYTDIVNAYGSKNPNTLPVITLERDEVGNGIIVNPNAPKNEQQYQINQAKNDRSKPLPYLGFIVEF